MDEYDLLFNNPGMDKAMMNIVRKFSGQSDPLFARYNMRRQFILAGSSIPKYIQGKPEFLSDTFPDLRVIKSSDFEKVNPKVHYDFVDLASLSVEPEAHLLRLVKEDMKGSSNIIVF